MQGSDAGRRGAWSIHPLCGWWFSWHSSCNWSWGESLAASGIDLQPSLQSFCADQHHTLAGAVCLKGLVERVAEPVILCWLLQRGVVLISMGSACWQAHGMSTETFLNFSFGFHLIAFCATPTCFASINISSSIFLPVSSSTVLSIKKF